MIKNLFIFLSFFTSVIFAQSSPSDTLLIYAIRNGNTKFVHHYININNIEKPLGEEKVTSLNCAVIYHQDDIAKYLIDLEANLEIPFNSKTPLLYACQLNNRSIAQYLIRHNANINALDNHKNSPLIFAAINGNEKLVKYLLRKGTFLQQKNHRGYTAYDYAVMSNFKDIADLLRQAHQNNLPSFTEGPHVFWNRKYTKAKVTYYVHKQSPQKSFKENLIVHSHDNMIEWQGLAGDKNHYFIKAKHLPDTFDYKEIEKIIVVGDVHGGYRPLVELLQSNGVIDTHHSWNWGKGHVVFIGDIMDKGDQVTECLWLIYKLEQEALKSGGRVHLLLGNHEVMNLQRDNRYNADKYVYLSRLHNIDYSRLFEDDTELGQWLRSKNTIIKINDILFVHGGLYSSIMKRELSTNTINNAIRCYLDNPETCSDSTLARYLLSLQGPLWYRGYVDDNPSYAYKMSEEQLISLLDYYGASRIIVGHTYVENISALYNNRVIATDVSYKVPFGYLYGVLIDSTGYYRVDTEGRKVRLF